MNGGDSSARTANVARIERPAMRKRVVRNASGTPRRVAPIVPPTATTIVLRNATR